MVFSRVLDIFVSAYLRTLHGTSLDSFLWTLSPSFSACLLALLLCVLLVSYRLRSLFLKLWDSCFVLSSLFPPACCRSCTAHRRFANKVLTRCISARFHFCCTLFSLVLSLVAVAPGRFPIVYGTFLSIGHLVCAVSLMVLKQNTFLTACSRARFSCGHTLTPGFTVLVLLSRSRFPAATRHLMHFIKHLLFSCVATPLVPRSLVIPLLDSLFKFRCPGYWDTPLCLTVAQRLLLVLVCECGLQPPSWTPSCSLPLSHAALAFAFHDAYHSPFFLTHSHTQTLTVTQFSGPYSHLFIWTLTFLCLFSYSFLIGHRFLDHGLSGSSGLSSFHP